MGSTKKPMSPEDALELSELLEKIKALDEVKTAVVQEETALDRLVRDLKNNKTISRALKGKGRYKPKQHWKTKAHKRRAYYAEVGAPKRRARIAEQMMSAEGWYDYIAYNWRRHRIPFDLTLEQWVEEVYPLTAGKGRVPVFQRYRTGKHPMGLANMIVRDMDTREVLFDSADYQLKKLGYTL